MTELEVLQLILAKLESLLERADSIVGWLQVPYVPTSASPEVWQTGKLHEVQDKDIEVVPPDKNRVLEFSERESSIAVSEPQEERGIWGEEAPDPVWMNPPSDYSPVKTAVPPLEDQIRAYLVDHPSAKGKEIIEATGGKQATVYSILRRLKLEKIAAEPEAPKQPAAVEQQYAISDVYDFTKMLAAR